MPFSLMTKKGTVEEMETAGEDSNEELKWKRKRGISPGRKARAFQTEEGNGDAHVVAWKLTGINSSSEMRGIHCL